jgi:transposase-like protein
VQSFLAQVLQQYVKERSVQVDHSNIYRWVQKFTPHLEAAFRNGKKRSMGSGWRMDETYIKVKGQWKYMYRAVDREGQTIDFLLTAHRDKKAALRFLKCSGSTIVGVGLANQDGQRPTQDADNAAVGKRIFGPSHRSNRV